MIESMPQPQAIRRAVVLAAGMGVRLRPYTELIPKPLLVVGGRPLILQTLSSLSEAGIAQAVVVVGYRGHEIEAVLSEVRGIDVQVVENTRFHLGASLSLAAARELCGEEDFLLVMSDHLLSPGLVRRLATAEPRDACRVAADSTAWPSHYVDEATLLQIADDGLVTRIGKHIGDASALDAGAFACTPEVWEALDSAPPDCDLSTVFTELVKRGRLFAADISGSRWYDIDTPDDISLAEEKLASDPGGAVAAL